VVLRGRWFCAGEGGDGEIGFVWPKWVRLPCWGRGKWVFGVEMRLVGFVWKYDVVVGSDGGGVFWRKRLELLRGLFGLGLGPGASGKELWFDVCAHVVPP
jgi:hypothetical protein